MFTKNIVQKFCSDRKQSERKPHHYDLLSDSSNQKDVSGGLILC